MLNPDFRDILFAFSKENVEYLLVGAYTLAAHGQVRATGDIDLWVKSSEDNAARIMDALTRFGAPLLDAVEFEEAWPAREEVEVAGLKKPVIGRHHLLKNKRATGRPKDLADAAWLAGDEESD